MSGRNDHERTILIRKIPRTERVERPVQGGAPCYFCCAESLSTMRMFFSYSHRDTSKLERLMAHLAVLRYAGTIRLIHDRQIRAGSLLTRELSARLESCDFFIAIVTPDFLASRSCRREMKRAIARHRAGTMQIVPVIFEHCDWKRSPLGRFLALPADGRPVSCRRNENEALLNVVEGLRQLIRARPPRPRPRR